MKRRLGSYHWITYATSAFTVIWLIGIIKDGCTTMSLVALLLLSYSAIILLLFGREVEDNKLIDALVMSAIIAFTVSYIPISLTVNAR
jgi:hypothetical protein